MAEDTEQFELPEGLVDGLREAYGQSVEIPAAVDRAVLAAAQAKFAQRRRMRLVARWGSGLAAGIAAVIVVMVWVHRPEAGRVVVKNDVNGDGRVNIVDALALARHLANGDKVNLAWDVNGDGVVDQRDVDALGQSAVSLKQGVAKASLPKLRELGIDHLANDLRRVPCPPEPQMGMIFDERLFGSGGHVLAGANMPTPADGRDRQSSREIGAGAGMAPGVGRNAVSFAEANPTKNGKEESR